MRHSMKRFIFILNILILVASGQTFGAKYPITVRGGDEKSFTPPVYRKVIRDRVRHDVIVVGGGLAGLSAAIYLSDQGKKVLLLEKEKVVGGLAAGGQLADGIYFDRGAAYWTNSYEEEQHILEHIGLGDFQKKHAIYEPIDSYLWNGEIYLGFWENKAELERLPASFELFKHELEKADQDQLIPNQPFEEFEHPELDQMSAAEWIRRMPERSALREDEESKRILARFNTDVKINRDAPMRDVIDFLDIYCRSALGSTTENLSAMSFANFYISEIEVRYTSPIGTGIASEEMEKLLKLRPTVTLKTEAAVSRIKSTDAGVNVFYLKKGRTHLTKADYVVFSSQLKFAPKLIEGLAKKSPEQAKLFSELEYAHYSVHIVEVKGHPFRATYDTWVRMPDYTDDDFTDVILGRWMDTKIRGYEGMRDFSQDPIDNRGILSIYHPLGTKWVGSGYTEDQAISIAEKAVDRLKDIFGPFLQKNWGTTIDVVKVETSRWPFSIHLATPGYFTSRVKIMRKPFERIHFAHSNLGTPAFEEALFRGHCAANNILKRMDPLFQQEEWTRCPLDVE